MLQVDLILNLCYRCNEEKPDIEVQYEEEQEGVGLCGFLWVYSHNAPLCLDCSASYGPILPHIPRHHPLYHQICSRATETGGPGPLHISFFKLDSSEKKAGLVTLWFNLPFLLWQTHLYPSKNEHYPPVLGAETHTHLDTHVCIHVVHSLCHSRQLTDALQKTSN